jgi:hypothetical protein
MADVDISDELFEKCLRALYHAPADKPSLPMLVDLHGGQTEGLRAAIAVAVAAAREDATEFVVSAHPDRESINWDSFAIRVKDCGRYGWGVLRWSRCMNRAGKWVNQPDRDDRDDAWFAEHRFDLDTALRMARAEAPHLRVNGSSLADVLEFERLHEQGAN